MSNRVVCKSHSAPSFFRIFSQEEYELIKKLTVKDLLVLTTHIRDGDMSDTPFEFDKNTVCPQPFQLSELYMDDCTSLTKFDYYYDQSAWEMSITWAAVFLHFCLVVLVRMHIAAYIMYRKAKVLASGLVAHSKMVEGTGSYMTSEDGEVLIFWEISARSRSELRQVYIKYGPGKCIKVYFSDGVLREIDLRHQTQLTIQRPSDDYIHLVVKIPHEHDIVLRCHNAQDRIIFINKLQAFLTDIGVGHTIEEPQKKIMLKTVYTKKDRQRLLENFFKSVFREGAQGAVIDIGETRKDILECELTRCLLYTSPSPRDATLSRMPSSA